MKAQKPAKGVTLVHDFRDSRYYRVDCDCGNEDDHIEVCVELDDFDEIIVQFEATQKTDWWKRVSRYNVYEINSPWLFSIVNSLQELVNGIAHRLRVTRDVWFRGYVTYSSSTILSEQAALNFSAALASAVHEIEKRNKEIKKK